MGEFFSGFSLIGEVVASAQRVKWSGVESPFFSPPSSYHPLLPSPPPLLPPPVYF